MKFIKKITLLAFALFSLQLQCDESIENFNRNNPDELEFNYKKAIIKPADGQIIENSIADAITNNYFNDGKTRTRTITQTKDDKIIIITETWTTKNPSYLTWKNGVFCATVAGMIAFRCFTLYQFNNLTNQSMQTKEDSFFHLNPKVVTPNLKKVTQKVTQKDREQAAEERKLKKQAKVEMQKKEIESLGSLQEIHAAKILNIHIEAVKNWIKLKEFIFADSYFEKAEESFQKINPIIYEKLYEKNPSEEINALKLTLAQPIDESTNITLSKSI